MALEGYSTLMSVSYRSFASYVKEKHKSMYLVYILPVRFIHIEYTKWRTKTNITMLHSNNFHIIYIYEVTKSGFD